MSKLDLQTLARQLAPWMKPIMQSSAGGSVVSGAPSPHGLNSTHHSGTLANSQAPQFLLTNGTRPLTGNLSVSAGVTIDGVDLSDHAADPGAHHNPVTLATPSGLSLAGQQLSLADSVAGSGLGISSKVLQVNTGNGLTVTSDAVVVNLASPSGLTFSGSALALDDALAGAGLAISGKVLAVGAGNGLTVNANDVALTTPGTLSVASANAAAGNHTHAVTSASNPGAAASILASSAAGYLQLIRVGLGVAPAYPLHARLTTEQLRLDYDASNYASFTVGSGGNLTIAPTGDFVFNPVGNDIMPATGYDLNLGSLQKKYLTLHAAELWVETLVAASTIATIGGRILVGPTTTLTADLASAATLLWVKHNQMGVNDVVYMEANGSVEFMRINGQGFYGVDTTTDYFALTGDWTSTFTAGAYFTVVNSTANDGEYETLSSSYDGGLGITRIYVSAVPDGTADGKILYVGEQGVGPFGYLSTARNLDGSGANDWFAGDAVFNTGQVGNGFIDLYSVRGVKNGFQAGPTVVGNVRNSTTYNDWTEHWAIGNLNGLYGYGVDTYGVGLGKYGTGSENYATFDATNGVRFFTGSTVQAQLSGSVWTMGVTTADHVRITSSGIQFKDNTTVKIDAQTDGDLFIGSNVANAANTYFSLFANAQTYNGESMGAGDLLIGNNSTGVLNLFWDQSGGTFLFRTGIVGHMSIASDGTVLIDNQLLLNADGLELSNAHLANREVFWTNFGGFTMGSIKGVENGTEDYQLYFDVPFTSGNTNSMVFHLAASSDSGEPARTMTFNQSGLTVPGVLEASTLEVSGNIYLNDASNTDMTAGLTINQGAADDEILAFKSSDVAHGMTALAETDTYGTLQKVNAASGGTRLMGLTEDVIGVYLTAQYTNDNTLRSTGASAGILLNASKKSGTGVTDPGANANLLAMRSNGATRFLVDQEGDIHMDATSNINAWDDHDDIQLLAGVREAMNPGLRLAEFVEEARPVLEKTGVVVYNPDGHHFISLKRLHALEIDAMRQLYQRLATLEGRLAKYEDQTPQN